MPRSFERVRKPIRRRWESARAEPILRMLLRLDA